MMPRVLGWAGVGLFVAIVAEIVAFIVVAHWLGVGLAVLLLVATSLLGGWLLRREGGRALRQLREGARAGQPVGELNPGLFGRLAGGVLLAVPGFVTDVVGLALLVPVVRRAAGTGVQRLVERQLPSALAGDLFGPRRVRVRPGRPTRPGRPRDASPVGAPIEGEIVDPG